MAYGDAIAQILRRRDTSHPAHPANYAPTHVEPILSLLPDLAPEQRLAITRSLAHDIEDPDEDEELGEPVERLETRAAGATRAAYDPTQLLQAHGFKVVQVVDPYYGYSGTFNPGGVFGHWTAGNGGQNTWVLAERHYHSLACADGVAYLGGYSVRQGHGGSGRTGPLNIALAGNMDLATIEQWQANGSADDTSSMPNQRFLSVSLDDPGVTGIPSAAQQDVYGAMVAAFLIVLGKHLGHYVDHAASTNRKIDLGRYTPGGYSVLERWYGTMTGDTDMPRAVAVAVHPSGKGAAMAYDDGRVITRDAAHYGDLLVNPNGSPRATPIVPDEPVNSLSWSTSGRGYVLGADDGATFAFGDAPAYGKYGR